MRTQFPSLTSGRGAGSEGRYALGGTPSVLEPPPLACNSLTANHQRVIGRGTYFPRTGFVSLQNRRHIACPLNPRGVLRRPGTILLIGGLLALAGGNIIGTTYAAAPTLIARAYDSGYLFRFDPHVSRVEILERITSEPSRRRGMSDKFRFFADGTWPSRVPSIAVGKDGSVYALARIARRGRTVPDVIRIGPVNLHP